MIKYPPPVLVIIILVAYVTAQFASFPCKPRWSTKFPWRRRASLWALFVVLLVG